MKQESLAFFGWGGEDFKSLMQDGGGVGSDQAGFWLFSRTEVRRQCSFVHKALEKESMAQAFFNISTIFKYKGNTQIFF